jgi:hypothetical protein
VTALDLEPPTLPTDEPGVVDLLPINPTRGIFRARHIGGGAGEAGIEEHAKRKAGQK